MTGDVIGWYAGTAINRAREKGQKGRERTRHFFPYSGETREREREREGNETNKLPNKLRKRLASIRRRGTSRKKEKLDKVVAAAGSSRARYTGTDFRNVSQLPRRL